MTNDLSQSKKSALMRAVSNPAMMPAFFERIECSAAWFDELCKQGLMDPQEMPHLEETSPRVPAWPITTFLKRFSFVVKENQDRKYADKLWTVLVKVTRHAQENEQENFRVWSHFVKIARNLPAEAMGKDYRGIIAYWLEGNFMVELVGDEVVLWLFDLLDSEHTHCSKRLALSLLREIYRVNFVKKQFFNDGRREALLSFKSHEFPDRKEELARKIGAAIGLDGIKIFIEKLEEVLAEERNDKRVFMWRRAIENHDQNRNQDDNALDVLVDAARDSLDECLQRLERGFPDELLVQLLESDFDTIRRIGIHLSSEHIEKLNDDTKRRLIDKDFFRDSFRHELWHFLKNHYGSLEPDLKEKVLKIISLLHGGGDEENGRNFAKRSAYIQAVWLESVIGFDEEIKVLHRKKLELIGEGRIEHPDFAGYWAGGFQKLRTSSATVAEIKKMSEAPEGLVRYLNDYEDQHDQEAYRLEELADTFGEFMKVDALDISSILLELKSLNPRYINTIFKSYLDLLKRNTDIGWVLLWPKILEFANEVVSRDDFWESTQSDPTMEFASEKYQAIRTLSIFIGSGCYGEDDNCFAEDNIPLAKQVLEKVIDNQVGVDFKNNADAMIVAANSAKGICLKAYLDLALYEIKNTNNKKDKEDVAGRYLKIFESELNKRDRRGKAEFEAVTILTSYYPMALHYHREWALSKMPEIFCASDEKKWLCAVQGFSYATNFLPDVYLYLKDHEYLISILESKSLKDNFKDRYIQMMGISCYRKLELIIDKSSMVRKLIERGNPRELRQLIWFIWTLRDSNDFDVVKNMVHDLFPLVLNSINTGENQGRQIAAQLCYWSVYVDHLKDKEQTDWLGRIAPFAQLGNNTTLFIRSIAGISRINRGLPSELKKLWIIWKKMFCGPVAPHDHPPKEIKQMLTDLAGAGLEMEAQKIASLYLDNGMRSPKEWLKEILQTSSE